MKISFDNGKDYNIELSRVKVKDGKSKIVDEWLKFLNDNMEDTILTLEGEKMYVETIHREIFHGEEFLYWYSIQGQGGIDVYESDSYIDKKHLEYWSECIDNNHKMEQIEPVVVMIPDKIVDCME